MAEKALTYYVSMIIICVEISKEHSLRPFIIRRMRFLFSLKIIWEAKIHEVRTY